MVANTIVKKTAPDDHFTPSPDRSVVVARIRRAGESRGPGIIDAIARSGRDRRKFVVSREDRRYGQRQLRSHRGAPYVEWLFQPSNRSELQPVFAFVDDCGRVVTDLVFL